MLLLVCVAADNALQFNGVDQSLQFVNLGLLRVELSSLTHNLILLFCDLCLLFFESIDEHRTQAVILHPFNLTYTIACHKQRLYIRHVLRSQTQIHRPVCLPLERNRMQAVDDIQSTGEPMQVSLVTQA